MHHRLDLVGIVECLNTLHVAVQRGGQQPEAIVIKSLALTVPFSCHDTKSVLLGLAVGWGSWGMARGEGSGMLLSAAQPRPCPR